MPIGFMQRGPDVAHHQEQFVYSAQSSLYEAPGDGHGRAEMPSMLIR